LGSSPIQTAFLAFEEAVLLARLSSSLPRVVETKAMLVTLALAIALFASTNIDDIFVLVGFFADARFRVRDILIGQYLGIGGSECCSISVFVVPSTLRHRPTRNHSRHSGRQESFRLSSGTLPGSKMPDRRSQKEGDSEPQ
jgi:hypothetical protein